MSFGIKKEEKKVNPLNISRKLTSEQRKELNDADTTPYKESKGPGVYLAQKWIKANKLDDMESQCNDFIKRQRVKYSQTHVTCLGGNPATVLYTCVMFYEAGPVIDAKREDVI